MRSLLARGLLILCVSHGVPGLADDPIEAYVEVRRYTTTLEGSTHPTNANGELLTVGESRQSFSLAQGCYSFSTSGSATRQMLDQQVASGEAAPGSLAWTFDYTLTGRDLDVFSFDLEWTRWRVTEEKTLRAEATVIGPVDLRFGERRVLDYYLLAEDEMGPCNYHSIYFELAVQAWGQRAFADAALGYRLWLLHRRPDGSQSRHVIDLDGRQGERVDFRFDLIPIPLTGFSTDEGEIGIALESGGEIRAWVSEENTFVVLDTTLGIRLPPVDNAHPPAVSSGGRKAFASAPGEVIKIVLPIPQSSVTIQAHHDGAGELPAGVAYRDGLVEIDVAELITGHELALVLEVESR